MRRIPISETLQKQYREAEGQLQAFAKDGDIEHEQASRILRYLRRSAKGFRPDMK